MTKGFDLIVTLRFNEEQMKQLMRDCNADNDEEEYDLEQIQDVLDDFSSVSEITDCGIDYEEEIWDYKEREDD